MVKTQWECEDCGRMFNSRAARSYHKNHNCPGQGTPENSEDQRTNPAPDLAVEVPPIEEQPKPALPEPDPEPVDRITIIEDEVPRPDEPDDIGDGWLFAVVIFFVLIITGLVIFRDKIMGLFRKKPPAIPVYPVQAAV